MILLYLGNQIRFLIGGERVTCRGSKLTNSLGRTKLANSLGKQHLELFDSHVIGTCSLKPRQICEPAGVKQTISSQFFSPTAMFPSASPRGNKTHCFPWGQSNKNKNKGKGATRNTKLYSKAMKFETIRLVCPATFARFYILIYKLTCIYTDCISEHFIIYSISPKYYQPCNLNFEMNYRLLCFAALCFVAF